MYDYQRMERIPFDVKMIDEIRRSPTMRAEQGEGWLSSWGGPSQYKVFAQLPMEQRLTYAAVLEGNTTQDQIEVVTGLTSGEVSKGLAELQKRGLVSVERVEEGVSK